MTPKLYVVTLWAEDIHACAHFYHDVIGLPLIDQHSPYPHFDLGGSFLVIRPTRSAMPHDREMDRFPIAAFTVEDLDTVITRLRQRHVDLPWGVEEDDDSRWAMFYDPGGNLIEVAQLKRR